MITAFGGTWESQVRPEEAGREAGIEKGFMKEVTSELGLQGKDYLARAWHHAGIKYMMN